MEHSVLKNAHVSNTQIHIIIKALLEKWEVLCVIVLIWNWIVKMVNYFALAVGSTVYISQKRGSQDQHI